MENSIFPLPCLNSKEFHRKEIYKDLFNKKIEDRFLESALQKFKIKNQQMFSFAGITLDINGAGNDLSIIFTTSGYIGAIPIILPHDGIAHKDFQITPRFDSSSDNPYADLSQLLSKLGYSITPEYDPRGHHLINPTPLRPPIYFEASKFIDLFVTAQKQNWVKFEVVKAKHNYPKSNTDWNKYALDSADPRKTLEYYSSDSVLSLNHKEWKNLKYVFELAKDILLQTNVPAVIRYKYQDILLTLEKKTAAIKPLMTKQIQIHAFDPKAIKEAKEQANKLLHDSFTSCVAWRMNMAELFERYVQFVVAKSLQNIGGTVLPNNKIRGSGQIPLWGLKYLEPDIMIRYNSTIFMGDAKYKSNFYNLDSKNDILKETHRADLHQLLAYCSFSPAKNKTGFLFYPATLPQYKKLSYTEALSGITNDVILCGLPFGIKGIDPSVSKLQEIFRSYL